MHFSILGVQYSTVQYIAEHHLHINQSFYLPVHLLIYYFIYLLNSLSTSSFIYLFIHLLMTLFTHLFTNPIRSASQECKDEEDEETLAAASERADREDHKRDVHPFDGEGLLGAEEASKLLGESHGRLVDYSAIHNH